VVFVDCVSAPNDSGVLDVGMQCLGSSSSMCRPAGHNAYVRARETVIYSCRETHVGFSHPHQLTLSSHTTPSPAHSLVSHDRHQHKIDGYKMCMHGASVLYSPTR